MTDSNDTSSGLRRRPVLARALAVVLCVALTAAGMLHTTHAQAGQYEAAGVAHAEACEPAGDVDTAIDSTPDSCAIAGECQSWMASAPHDRFPPAMETVVPAALGAPPGDAALPAEAPPPKSRV